MESKSCSLYYKAVLGIVGIVLFSILGAWMLITGISYALAFVCLLFILFISMFIIRLITYSNKQISIFFESLHNKDTSLKYQQEIKDPFCAWLYKEMNEIISLIDAMQKETEEKKVYYENLLKIMSHELRNSITPISSLSADLLENREQYTSQQIEESLEIIHSQSKSLSLFLESYYNLTHLPDPVKEEVSIGMLFTKLQHLLSREPQHEKVCYQDTSLKIKVDPHLITLTLINLIRNALQAIENQSDGRVIIKAEKYPDKICISVTDNGPGIPSTLLSSIFTPFFSTRKEGSGIGLSISRRIMELHGGAITVQSWQEIKTEFKLVFLV